jgi:beta-lactamase superfamily II metal-dependent hydrolase
LAETVERREEQDAIDTGDLAVHLLDVGPDEYGDAVLCSFGDVSVLIDGSHPGDYRSKDGHPSIPQQLETLLGQQRPYQVTLLIVTHAHQDHIGCLPYLVENDVLRADWALVADPGFGWGRPSDDAPTDQGPEQHPVNLVGAALREEIRTEATDDDALLEFMTDALDLRSRYEGMLVALEERGTRVVRYGRDEPSALLEEFRGVGLRLLGPTEDQLIVCADKIGSGLQDALDAASEHLAQDAPTDPAGIYRGLVGAGTDSLDATSRLGPAVNLQSIVLRFEYGGRKFLFTGDMQLADPEVPGLENYMHALHQAIQSDGPYDFAKIAHHGSYNAFDEQVLSELGGVAFLGICAGADSLSHPNPETLRLLEANAGSVQWARTDRNGLTTLTTAGDGLRFETSTGSINDPTPNTRDRVEAGRLGGAATGTATGGPVAPQASGGEVTRRVPSLPPPAEPVLPTATTTAGGPGDVVEVLTRIPHASTRVTLTIDVAPAARPIGADLPPQSGRTVPAALEIAGGRSLPELLFITSRQALAENVGQTETDYLLEAIRQIGMPLYDAVPPRLQESSQVMDWVRPQLRSNPEIEGVVLLGGYDVLPAQRLDALDPELRRSLPSSSDPDNFIVWSDDVYGDRDGDGLPELPVSRIPDGKSSRLLFAAMQVGDKPVGAPRNGVRNVARPFAEDIYKGLPGAGTILVSEPTISTQTPPFDLAADRVYLMLHGSDEDGSRFWGETSYGGALEAIHVGNVPTRGGRVVFTGCCWGALTVDPIAVHAGPGRGVAQRTPGSSIALSFLASGITAFVGCTGAHYSPTVPPYQEYGGPLHEAFWKSYNAGVPPAQALFDAKRQYVGIMGHGSGPTRGSDRLRTLAIEKKIFRQFTCLGLGW